MDDRLRRFAHFIAWLSDEHGRVPKIGDDDEGRVLTFGGPERAYAASVACAVAGYLADPAPGPRPAEHDLRDVIFRAPKTSGALRHGVRTFPKGGYTVIREVKKRHLVEVVFDHGPLGYLAIAAHAHADALSFTLVIDGEPILVDPGTYLYYSGGLWRDWFRGTAAHNTLTIECANQSEIAGPFNWSRKAVTTLENVGCGASWFVTASHDGYCRRFGVRHRRTISATEDGFSVHDTLEGEKPKVAGVAFQLAPTCSAQVKDDVITVLRNKEHVLAIRIDCSGEIRLNAGGDIGGGGWYSPSFGLKVPATRVRWLGVVPPCGITSTFAFL